VLPTRCVHGILALSLALAALSFILTDRTLLATGAVVLLFLLWRGIVFQGRFAALLGRLAVHRETDATLARQGSEIGVVTRLEWKGPLPLACRVEDLVPGGSVIDEGKATAEIPAGSEGPVILRYRMRVMSRGEVAFGGIALAVKDPFFSTGTTMSTAEWTRPELHIHPAGVFKGEGGGGGFGEREQDRLRSIPSLTIRSFRAFRSGDSLKTVDWKLSAKFRKLYVREYAGLMGEPPILVIDLPDRSAAAGEPEFDRLMGAIQGAVEKAVRFHTSSSLIVISGPNLVEYLPLKRDMARWFSVQRQLVPMERLVHAFRATGAAEMAQKLREHRPGAGAAREPAAAGSMDFTHRIERIAAAFSWGEKQTVFELQVASILAEHHISELYLFSLLQGDTTHLRRLAEIARTFGMRVHAVIPRGAATPFRKLALSRSGVGDIMEVA